jgi:hypothetical protein
MTYCLCCSNQMLRHLRGHQIQWFCRHCWQEMPSLERNKLDSDKCNLFSSSQFNFAVVTQGILH